MWKAPLKWAREARATGQKIMVFGNSLYDLFEDHPTVNGIRKQIWDLVDKTRDAIMTPSPNLDPDLVRESSCPDWGWKGFSDEEATQCRADRGLASAG